MVILLSVTDFVLIGISYFIIGFCSKRIYETLSSAAWLSSKTKALQKQLTKAMLLQVYILLPFKLSIRGVSD